jgi:hypothetical protein
MSSSYSNKYADPIKINDFTLIKLSYTPSKNCDFLKVDYSQFGAFGNHYIEVNDLVFDGQGNPTDYIADINTVVWDRGSNEYAHRQNHDYIEGTVYTPALSTLIRDKEFLNVEFFIPQLFNWKNIYGIHLIIKGANTEDIYVSKIIPISGFNISESRELYYGQFWMESNNTRIPSVSEDLYIQTTIITTDQISLEGYDYNYPNTFEPLIEDKIFPSFITTDLSFDKAKFLHIFPMTLESKTLENSLKDYFGYSRDKIVPITIQHVVSFQGLNQNTQQYETHQIRVSNEENNFSECVVGLNLMPFIDLENPEELITITVNTEINVDGKFMYRENSISTDFSTEIANFLDQFVNPTSVIFQDVTETTQVNQTVINKPTTTKIVKVYQPIFVKYIEQDITYARTNISFENITEKSFMVVGDETIQSDVTSDGKYYFNLTKLTPPKSDTPYKLYLSNNETEVGSGMMFAKEK